MAGSTTPCPPFPSSISYINDGEQVDQLNANRPLNQLDSRTNHLKCRLDQALLSQAALVLPGMPVTNSVVNGDAVFLDSTVEKFEQARAFTILSMGEIVVAPDSFAWGIAQNVAGGAGERTADIYKEGLVLNVVAATMIESTETFVTPDDFGKPYYVSAVEPGKITKVKPAISVIVGYFLDATTFLVSLDIRNLGENHVHIRMVLDRMLFGVLIGFPNPVPGGPDSAWLYPAASLDPWPPMPAEGTVLEVNGISYLYGEDYFITEAGLYLTTLVSSPLLPAPPVPPPPPFDSQNYVLHFIMPASDTQAGVLSLIADNGNIEIRNCIPGGPITTGQLKIGAITRFNVVTNVQIGPKVLKAISYNNTSDQVDLEFGPVVAEIVAGRNVSVAEDNARPGRWRISSAAQDEILQEVRDIALRNAKEVIHGERRTAIQFLGDGTPTGILGKVFVPGSLPAPTFSLIAFYVGEQASDDGVLATKNDEFGFTLSYYFDAPGGNWNTPFIAAAVPAPMELGVYTPFTGLKTQLFSIPLLANAQEGQLHFRLDRRPTTDFANPYLGAISMYKLIYRIPLI